MYLQPQCETGNLVSVKRVLLIVVVLVVVVGAVFFFWQRLSGGSGPTPATKPPENASSAAAGPTRPAPIVWQSVDHSTEGFKIDMPPDVKQTRVPAYNEQGGQENVDMILANADPNTTYSISWQAYPPVERVNKNAPDATLDMALKDALDRSQTALVSQSEISQQGFPGRQFSARNSNGGVMDSRLVLARGRLYMLTAAFPSADARRDDDVARFFNSFSVVPTSKP